MMRCWVTYICCSIVLLALCACQTTAIGQAVLPTATIVPTTAVYTPVSTVVLATATSEPTASPTTATATPEASATTEVVRLSLGNDVSPSPSATIAATAVLQFTDHYFLERPIAQDGDNVHWVDRTYPYGTTQFGAREVHLGVEFVNTRFTRVLAAADGEVVYAGADAEQQFGPQLNYYGNLVVIRHDFTSATDLAIYTLYGHLQDIAVETRQRIQAGDRIGRVGDSGIAIGPHLHFEVRVGTASDYRRTRNPELWLRPYPGFGTLAGRITDGSPAEESLVVLVRDENLQREAYIYAGERVNSDALLGENFVLGDLPAGEYEIIINAANGRNRYRDTIEITASQTTFVAINLE